MSANNKSETIGTTMKYNNTITPDIGLGPTTFLPKLMHNANSTLRHAS